MTQKAIYIVRDRRCSCPEWLAVTNPPLVLRGVDADAPMHILGTVPVMRPVEERFCGSCRARVGRSAYTPGPVREQVAKREHMLNADARAMLEAGTPPLDALPGE